ncbi:phage tail tape measure protein [Mannheimia pernigra]|uniref:phage tail tape measure protein n=1 Tax=Mannheimia pernigra TaxID=111844 RepID=UPI001318DDEF|nr:phage tail tape measure protein [Mannheimia pernigra]QHB18281.1 phage tail tape measure protein [Mannheimia pernigra]
MSGLGKLTVTLELENVKFQSALLKSDYEAQKFAKNFIQNMDKAKSHAKEFADRSTKYLQTIEKAAKNINKNTEWAWWSAAGKEIGKVGSYITQASKAYTDIHNKMKLVSNSSAEAALRLTDVFDISMKTSQSTEAVAGVYQTFATNAQSLGLAQKDVAELTKTVSQAVAASGASSSAASNALTQFGQSLLMGKMKAQEFNSLITQTPTIVQAMAKGLGMTMAEFKAAVDDGKISTVEMVKGLKNSSSYVDELAGKMGVTLDGAMTNLSTAFTKWVGETDNAWGVSRQFAESINTLAQNLNAAAPYALSLGAALGGMQLGKAAEQTWTLINAKRQEVLESQKQAQNILFKTKTRMQEVAQELKATQAYIANLQAQMSLARTEQQRALITQELHIQTQRETALIQQQTVAIKALETAQNQANVAKRMGAGLMTALGGPWGIAMGIIAAGAIALFDWSQKANQAREEALRYADSLDSVRANIEKMTKAQTDAEMVKLSRSIREQESALADLKQRQAELTREIEQGATVLDDAFGAGVRLEKSAKDLAKAQEELKLVTADVEKTQNTLNASLEAQKALQAHVQIANLRDEFVKLYPHIDESQIKLDGLNLAIGHFTVKSPEMVIAANNIANALGGVAGEAMRAAVLVANLSNMKLDIDGAAVIDPKHLEKIEQIERNNAIGSAKGKDKIALQVKDAMIKSGLKEGDAGYERLKAAYEQQFTRQNAPKDRGRSDDSARYGGHYQNQVAEMTNRLASLKANAADITIFGQVSDYQEVRKLTEDIAINAEKYKGYGEQGVARLKELAAKIDSEQQLLAIEQFQVDHDKKLKSMQFELDLLGKTRTEKELLQFSNQLDLETERLKINMTKENIALLDEKIAKIKEEYKLHQKKQEETRASAMMGIKEGWNNIEADVSNVAANVANITQNTFDGMADNLNNFIMIGKADFRSFAQSVLNDISKMLIKMALFNAIKQGMSFMGFSDGGLVGGSFAIGGYTGDGGKYTPAGIVHKGEYVITKEATSRLGLDYLNYLNYGKRGFASGGGVAVPRVPSSSYQPKSAQSSISVQVINNGEPVDAKVSQKQQGEQTQITVELMRKIARQEANGMIQNNFRAGGVFA